MGKLVYFLTQELDKEGEFVCYRAQITLHNNRRDYAQGDFSSVSLEGLASEVIKSKPSAPIDREFLPIQEIDEVVTVPSYHSFGSKTIDKVPLAVALRFRKLLEQASESSD